MITSISHCKARLEAGESTIQAAIRVLEQAVFFARNLSTAYKRAPDPIKRQLLSIAFKEVIAKDGSLQKIVLNEPLDYLCKDFLQIKNFSIKFDGEAFGEPSTKELETNFYAIA